VVPAPLTEGGLKLAVTPAGELDAEKVTGPPKPPLEEIEME
jgi:hypothetical protein